MTETEKLLVKELEDQIKRYKALVGIHKNHIGALEVVVEELQESNANLTRIAEGLSKHHKEYVVLNKKLIERLKEDNVAVRKNADRAIEIYEELSAEIRAVNPEKENEYESSN